MTLIKMKHIFIPDFNYENYFFWCTFTYQCTKNQCPYIKGFIIGMKDWYNYILY